MRLRSRQKFAHDTTAMLSWHAQASVATGYCYYELKQYDFYLSDAIRIVKRIYVVYHGVRKGCLLAPMVLGPISQSLFPLIIHF